MAAFQETETFAPDMADVTLDTSGCMSPLLFRLVDAAAELETLGPHFDTT